MFEPENEQGVVLVFGQRVLSSPWQVVSIGTAFPDAILERDGEQWRVEFEYLSSNFDAHGHDLRECDAVICWVHDSPNLPIPVIQLIDPDALNRRCIKTDPPQIEIGYWKRRALKAEWLLRQSKTTEDVTVVNRAEERQAALMAILADMNGQPATAVNITEIAKRLGATRPTIYSDIQALQDAGELSINGTINVTRKGRIG